MSRDVAAVVLAAGKGTRFRSDLAKVLHRAAGRSLLRHVLEALRPLGLGQVIVVVGHQADAVTAEAEGSGLERLTTVVQADQRGTGHAVQQALPALADDIRRVLVLPGDTPLLEPGTLTDLISREGVAATLLSAELEDPTGYGRVLRDDSGDVTGIVEHGDASEAQRAVREINAGMYLVDREVLVDAIGRLENDNEQGELYLTDIVGIMVGDGHRVTASLAPADQIAGVNDRAQLADAAVVLRRRHLEHLMVDVGVTVVDPATAYVDVDVSVGQDAVLLPNTILESGTVIGERATVGPNTHLTGVTVAADATVHSTRAVDAVIGPRAAVGPFTHLRPGTVLSERTKAGAFVETKNASLAAGAKAGHLAYVGDATVGEKVNIGCGVVLVNYDGHDKHHSTIEDGAFVGSGTMVISPVTIGRGAYVAAGSAITDDVPDGALAIARERQTNKEGWAAKRQETDVED